MYNEKLMVQQKEFEYENKKAEYIQINFHS